MVTNGVLTLSCIGSFLAGVIVTLFIIALVSANGRD